MRPPQPVPVHTMICTPVGPEDEKIEGERGGGRG